MAMGHSTDSVYRHGRYEKIAHLGDAPIFADRHSLRGNELPDVARRGTMKHPNPGRVSKTLAAVPPEPIPLMGSAGSRYLDGVARRGG